MIEILVFLLFGFFLGVVTGLVPGLHPNLLATFFAGFVFANPLATSIILISAVVTNSFLDFIPAIFLGAPEASTAMGVLPGHKFLLEGRGPEAVKLTVVGGIISLFFILLLLPVVYFYVPFIYEIIKNSIHWILIGIIIFSLLRDRKKLLSLFVFLISGVFGYLVLNYNFLGSEMALFPMLTGLFGISMLVFSIRKNPVIPEQNKSLNYIGIRETTLGGIIGTLSGMVVGLLPGIGPAQATYLSQEMLGERKYRNFMISLGGINTTNAVFSLLALWLINKPRSGAAVAVGEILGQITWKEIMIFIGVIIIVSGLAGALTVFLSENIFFLFRKINYQKLCKIIIVFLFLMIFLITGPKGLFIGILGTLIGMVCIFSNVRRSYLMGSLIIPTIIYFLGL